MSKEATQAQHAKQRLLAGKTQPVVQRVRAGQAPQLSCDALGVQRQDCCTGNCSQGRTCPRLQPSTLHRMSSPWNTTTAAASTSATTTTPAERAALASSQADGWRAMDIACGVLIGAVAVVAAIALGAGSLPGIDGLMRMVAGAAA